MEEDLDSSAFDPLVALARPDTAWSGARIRALSLRIETNSRPTPDGVGFFIEIEWPGARRAAEGCP